MRLRQSGRATAARGVSLTELIVVVGIIALLASIVTPIAVSQATRARIVAAQADTAQIARSMDECGVLMGFYVPIHVLDNLAPFSGPRDRDDMYNDAWLAGGDIYLIDPAVDPFDQLNRQLTLADGRDPIPLNVRVGRLYRDWGGPFYNSQRVFKEDNPDERLVLRRDFPLDPWGQPYRFYCNIGLIGSTQADSPNPLDWEYDNVFNGRLPTSNVDDDLFDRFAIVSYGPDMELDTDQEYRDGDGDDIYTEFGGTFGLNSFKALTR